MNRAAILVLLLMAAPAIAHDAKTQQTLAFLCYESGMTGRLQRPVTPDHSQAYGEQGNG